MEAVLESLPNLSEADKAELLRQLGVTERHAIRDGAVARDGPNQSFFNRKFRLFSGKSPVPSGEVDFKTWRLQVHESQDDEDAELPECQLKRLIRQSLLRPALDTVQNCASSTSILEILDNLYGSVEDGQDLLVQFYTTYQNEKESASSYLQKLYLLLMDVADKDGISVADVPTYLLRQFVRGSHEDILIHRLGFEDMLDDPPSFAEALLKIRKEEAKRTEKKLRLKSAGRVHSRIQNDSSPTSKTPSSPHTEDHKLIQQLQSKVEELQVQVQQQGASAKAPNKVIHDDTASTTSSGSHGSSTFKTRRKQTRRKGFCFKCGEDSHYMDKCQNASNPVLVQKKLQDRYSGN